MKILDARLRDWESTQWDNTPTVELLVEQLPNNDERLYEWLPVRTDDPFSEGPRIFYSNVDGLVRFMLAKGPWDLDEQGRVLSKQDRGYGGRHFEVHCNDGLTYVLRGPWSSNSESVESVGFPISREVSITDDPEVWERGHTFLSGAIDQEHMAKVAEILPTDDPKHAWVWVTNDLGFWMPALVKGKRNTGQFYRPI